MGEPRVYREAELGLWESVGAHTSQRRVRLERTGALVGIPEMGNGEPAVGVRPQPPRHRHHPAQRD